MVITRDNDFRSHGGAAERFWNNLVERGYVERAVDVLRALDGYRFPRENYFANQLVEVPEESPATEAARALWEKLEKRGAVDTARDMLRALNGDFNKPNLEKKTEVDE